MRYRRSDRRRGLPSICCFISRLIGAARSRRRCAGRAGLAGERLPLDRSVGHGPDRDDDGDLRSGAGIRTARLARGGAGFLPRPRLCATRRCCISPWGFWARRSCRTTFICTRHYPDPAVRRRHQGELKDASTAPMPNSTVALTLALFVNAAILILAAAAFYRTGHHEVGDIQGAYKLLTPLLGVGPGDAAVCHRPAGIGPKLDADRHDGGADHPGGVHAFPDRPLAAADDLAPAGHRPDADHRGLYGMRGRASC